MGKAKTYTIPASSSPWTADGVDTSELNKQLVHYAGVENNGANYTWCAATASKGKNCAGATTTVDESEYSICPRGWKLPSISEYESMMRAAKINFRDCKSSCTGSSSASDSVKIRSAPYGFVYAGTVRNSLLDYVGSLGYYWSSTTSGIDLAYDLYFSSSNVGVGGNARYEGQSIRCIAP